jgi:uncharacterized protein
MEVEHFRATFRMPMRLPISVQMPIAKKSVPNRISLLLAACFTFLSKVRRHGVVEVTKALAEVCFAEPPFAALAHHREVIAFFEQPSLAPLRSMPLANKYLSAYLGKSLGKLARRDILLHHYRRILESAVPGFFEHVFTDSYLLWSKEHPNGSCAIRLTFNQPGHYEGDLSLVFMSNELRIFDVSFTIVPGSAIGAATKELLFIARVQGAKSRFVEIKRATKACGDVAPQHMLMLAVQSVAQALGIAAIAGVAHDDILPNEDGEPLKFDYDRFWENWADRPKARHFYEIAVPLPRTSLSEIQADHRRRTQRKRAFKKQVCDDISAALQAVFPARSPGHAQAEAPAGAVA